MDIGELILIEEHEDGTETLTSVLCKVRSARRMEVYSARVAEAVPQYVFAIYAPEYNDERLVEYKGDRYRITRTYQTNSNDIEITAASRRGL